MKKRTRFLGAWLAVGLALLSRASSQSLFTLEDDTRNIFSLQPSTAYPPPPPSLDEDPRTPTANQWKSGTTIGGWLTTRIKDGAGTMLAGSPDTVAGPTTVKLPSFTPNDGSGVQLQSVQMGRPLAGRVPTVLFGEVIARPTVDQAGIPIDQSDYLPNPDNISGGKFYYSPHARSVFATQSGVVDVVWRFRDPAHVPATITLTYVVSASPARPAKRMYWTEKGFNGPLVQVPQGPISTLNVIYSPQFPANVGAEYDSPYDVPPDPALQAPPEKRTLWFSTTDRSLHAYNAEGRVFLEILGALKSDNVTRQFLGTEIVEVIREVAPLKVEMFVGDKVLPHNGDEILRAKVVNGMTSTPPFLHMQALPSKGRQDYYAIRTTNQSTEDPGQPTGEVLIHWMETGNFNLIWPKFYETYVVSWPEAIEAYSTYARQDQADGDAQATGVALEATNNPYLVFQDDPNGQQAFVKNGATFYTTIGTDPDGRALIRYTNGEKIWFERVYSKLDSTFTGFTGTPIPADVGTRIEPPVGYESAVGYIRQTSGTDFDPTAYKDPFVDGVANAKNGAIIGVNARPGHNILEIWWYKANNPPAGSGLKPTYWPATVQKYALQWPTAPPEIIMASNRGTGELPSLQANGLVYYQNDKDKPGFNPNDEHAVMIAGRAWALRDDLGTEQTSLPYVLLRYREADSRPAMNAFKVLREKESEGIVFNYDAIAGKILQAPMPLPVLPLPYLEDGSVANVVAFELHDAAPNGNAPLDYDKFTFKDRKGSTWVYRGPHTDTEEPFFDMQYYYVSMEGFFLPGVAEQPAPGTIMPYLRPTALEGGYDGDMSGASDQSLAITFRAIWPTSAPQLRLGETLTLPKYGLPAVRTQTSMQVLYDQALALEDDTHSVVLFDPTRAKTYGLAADGLSKIPGSVATSDYRGKTYFPNLPPHLSQRVYFDANLGEKGSLVFIGEFKDEAFGEDYLLLNTLSEQDRETLIALCDDGDDDFDAWTEAIEGLETIVETFTEDPTKRGTYKAIEPTTEDVVDTAARDTAWNWMYDFEFMSEGIYFSDVTERFPDKNAQELTPLWKWINEHKDQLNNLRRDYREFAVNKRWENGPLIGRNRGYTSWLNEEKRWHEATSDASLTRARDEVNAWYNARPIFPPSARAEDINELNKRADQLKRDVATLKDDLTKKVYTTVQPQYVTSGQDELTEITDPDTAVDSYALTAAGGGEGWVVLVSGNGKAFTPEGEPVSVHVIRVTAPLGRGELKVIAPSNPLDEKLTLQQSLDFAAKTENYEFEWRYAPPVDGLPPVLYSYDRALIMGDGGPWTYTNGEGVVTTLSLPSSLDGHAGTSPVTLSRTFNLTTVPLRFFLSLDLGANDGVTASINGTTVASWNVPGTANTAVVAKPSPDFSPLSRLLEISANSLAVGSNTLELTVVTTADAGAVSFVNARLEAMQATEHLASWISMPAAPNEEAGIMPGSITGKNRHVIQGPGIFTLTDNYFVCRFRATDPDHAAYDAAGGWSKWTEPQLAEGWIKRALAGINPFQQRVTDLYNNAVNTDVSLVTQAGRRWEGDISLNLANINQFGLIEIYETILRRGKSLSIEGTPPLSYGPANDALLLAAGYLNDLYMIVGNEAYADAANPTIAYNTDSGQFGDVATSLFAFKGQVATVLDEELGLLRGRDDFLPPGTRTAPVYNRLVWNYTRGIDSGEAVYALNYNIKDLNSDGVVSAADAAIAYPQGHGDAYGHYLTAMTNYYSLLRNSYFDWMPRSEAVLLLGKPVAVDYLDERKFATAAAALARTTSQTLDLTYRQAFNPAAATVATWTHLKDGRVNSQTGRTRNWGVDDWATRGGQGSFLHWVTANSTLPDVDPNPNHEGIQKIDRTTVPELAEIVVQSKAIQQSLDAADARLNPLGISGGALPFDISPTQVDAGKTHFEQIYERAVDALRNAVAAFNNAKTTTQLIRSQDESLAKARDAINAQERAFTAQLIDLYGTPYGEDVGPGKTYAQGYEGPDYYHFMYADIPELFKNQPDEEEGDRTFTVQNGTDWNMANIDDARWKAEDQRKVKKDGKDVWELNPLPDDGLGEPLVYTVDSTGNFKKPDNFTRRARPGRIQDAISEVLMARLHLHNAVEDYAEFGLQARRLIRNYKAVQFAHDDNRDLEVTNAALIGSFEVLIGVGETLVDGIDAVELGAEDIIEAIKESLPTVVGLATDATSAARGAAEASKEVPKAFAFGAKEVINVLMRALNLTISNLERTRAIEASDIAWTAENKQMMTDLKAGWEDLEDGTRVIDQALRAYDDAKRKLRAATYDAQRIVSEREIVRQKAAALIQGYRTKDFGFRAFRNEALESYKSLFDLSARYTFLAARAYDYETGLANAAGGSRANDFFQKIVQARALGVVANGQPQNAGSQGGDPGLSGALARMNSDWSVVKSRLGFNNPDRYRTLFSLRQENERIVPGTAGDTLWSDKLAASRMSNILDDDDVRRYCMQVNSNGALSVPGYVIPFSTTIATGFNFFGQPLAGGDSTFTPTSFATKIRSNGIAFKGYVGMATPTSIGGAVVSGGGGTPTDPNTGFLDPNALSATPYVYLIAAGEDSMRSPALGDSSVVRTWQVEDQAIALPFDIGGADIGTNIFTPGQSLSETFTIRKHQAFRAVPDGTVFSSSPGFTNSRLIGRSAWNSRWKIVIPANTLLADPVKGMQIFEATVKDIKLYLETYSYSGN